MIVMIMIGSGLATAFVGGLIGAAVADRRRAIRVDSDTSRFAAPVLNPKLPWA